MRRLLAVFVLAAATWLAFFQQEPLPPPVFDPHVGFVDVMPELAGTVRPGSRVTLSGAWRILGRNRDFGSYSALARLPDGRLLAVSDKNGVLLFDVPGSRNPPRARIRPLWGVDTRVESVEPDCEAIALDPASGDIWTAYEGNDRFWVFSSDFFKHRPVAAPVLAQYPDNSGPEAMTRLASGRFVALIENRTSLFTRSRHPGLLWQGAPRANEEPLHFTAEMPQGYRPTEAAPLPDGRMLVLGRKMTLLGFRSVIGVADPRGLREGGTLTVAPIAEIADHRISDNYEGMTTRANADGSTTIWLISDSNVSSWLQRSMLLQLEWRERG
jgi:hypothetical protein